MIVLFRKIDIAVVIDKKNTTGFKCHLTRLVGIKNNKIV